MNDDLLDTNLVEESKERSIELISVRNFIILYILTLGIYGVWWMYKGWKFFKEKDNLDIIPVARALFAIFFTYSLFERIQNYAHSEGYQPRYSSSMLFISFVILNILSRLPDPFWLISLLSFVCLLQPLNAFNNTVASAENYFSNMRNGFNTKQMIIVVIGAIFWIMLVIGLMMTPEEF